MFREVKVLVQKHVARFKLRLAGTKAHVLKYEADLLLLGSGLGEVPPRPFVPASSASPSRVCAKESAAPHQSPALQGNPARRPQPGLQQAPMSPFALTGPWGSF